MGDKIIEGDEEVIFAVTGAKPDTLEQAVVNSDSPTRITNSFSTEELFRYYITQMCLYLNNNPTIVATRFDSQMVYSYAQFMRFKLEDENKLTIRVRPLKQEEYILALKQTTPELGALLEETDIKEHLPLDELNLYTLKPFQSGLFGLADEAGRKALVKLWECSTRFTYIPDLSFFSFFLENGAQLREYLDTMNYQPSPRPVFEIVNDSSRTGGSTALITNLPKTEELFVPSNVLSYVRQKGKREVRMMVEEYKEMWVQVKSMESEQAWAVFQKHLYYLLEKNNPDLVLK